MIKKILNKIKKVWNNYTKKLEEEKICGCCNNKCK